jgi:hypothetical protein
MGAGVLLMCLSGCIWLADSATKLTERLAVHASKTTLGVGESARITVRKKDGLKTLEVDPNKTTYFTTSELVLVVEPDGTATCVGTYGRPTESAWITADNGSDHGHLSFDLQQSGPGPSLELITEPTQTISHPGQGDQFIACCTSGLVVLKEGEQMKYRIVRRAGPHEDVTASSTYVLFFGSGVPNDPHPSVITGSPDYVSSRNVRVDKEHGTITAPASIGRSNRQSVIVFVRHGDLVGWREIAITHVEGSREEHLKLHPNDP